MPAHRRALTVLATAGTLVVLFAMGTLWLRGRSIEAQFWLYIFHNGPPAILLFWLGRLVLIRQPRNRVGWVLETIAVFGAVHVVCAAWADWALVAWGYTEPVLWDHPLVPADLPLSASIPFWLMTWVWIPQPVLMVGVLPLIFPDGRLPGRRWRVGLWLTGLAATVLMAAAIVDGWPTSTWSVADGPPAAVSVLFAVGGVAMLAAASVALAGLVKHWRGTPPGRRQPFHVVGTACGLLAVLGLATYPWPWLWIPTVLVAVYVVLAAYGLAAARFRIHDLEPVLGRAAVADGLALATSAAYAGVVVGAGLLATRWTDSVAVPLVTAGVVALLAEPVRRGTRGLLGRLVLRMAADRAHVVSRLAARVTADDPAADTLADVARLLRRGTGADRAEVWLFDERETRLRLDASDGVAPEHPVAVVVPVLAPGGETTLGEIRILLRARADLAPGAEQTLADAAHILGTALHNRRLTERLEGQLEELRHSRRRIVEAQDTARRDLERDLHDGAQAQLVSLRLRLAAIQATADVPDPQLAGLAEQIGTALDSLRQLARGVHPPILDQAGFVPALRAHVRTLAVPVHVRAGDVPRVAPAVETAAYFSCLEAVQNAMRHSGASTIDVEVVFVDGELRFCVTDDGRGFDPATASTGTPGRGLANAADRLAAVGGRLRIDSRPGNGTRIAGSVPAPVDPPVPG